MMLSKHANGKAQCFSEAQRIAVLLHLRLNAVDAVTPSRVSLSTLCSQLATRSFLGSTIVA